MKNILVFTTSVGRARTEMLAGIHEFAQGSDWNVRTFGFDGTPFPVRELLAFWTPGGCIVEGSGGCRPGAFPKRAFTKTPVVYLGSTPQLTPPGATCILHDATAAVRLATRELLRRDLRQFAFVGVRNHSWSQRRKEAFLEFAHINGIRIECLDLPSSRSQTDTTSGERLRRWLQALEKPCGLLSADDTVAETVLAFCRLQGISVPEDISVVGVDDNETICNHTTPTLTSAHPDFRQGGRFAARLLAKKMLGAKHIPAETHFATSGLTRRGSTRVFRRRDADVAAALERIHAPGGERLGARDILAKFPCSRRNAEMRFRVATGRSILEEIMEVRIERAKEMLADTDESVSAIAELCGYRFPARFINAFKAACGITPQAWRRANADD